MPPLADQLERAAISIALNIAEGAGEFSAREKARFYRLALRSTIECAAALDLWTVRAGDASTRTAEGRRLLAEIAALLTTMTTNATKRASRRKAGERG